MDVPATDSSGCGSLQASQQVPILTCQCVCLHSFVCLSEYTGPGRLLLAQGFFYNQYPAPNITGFGERGQNTGANTDQQLWYHEVGTAQDQDVFVLALPEQPTWSISASFTYARE